MNSKERFIATINYSTPDRPMLSPLEGQNRVWVKLYDFFEVPYHIDGDIDNIPTQYGGFGGKTHETFMSRIGMDFRGVGPGYIGPELKTYGDGSWEGIWGERWDRDRFEGGTYEKTCYLPFAKIDDIGQLKSTRFPSAEWFDYSGISEQCDRYKDYAVFTGGPGNADFINGISFLRGVEQVLIDIALEDPVYLYIVEKRYEFFYEHVRRILEAAKGKIDAVRFGEDLGTQLSPIISPETFSKLLGPKYKALFDMVHSYGAKTMLHSCGSVRAFIPIFIDLGLDILEVVHVDAKGMDIEGLHRDFYKKLVFCGSISVQTLLPKGSPAEIEAEIHLRKELFHEGGIIIGPTNIMQVDMPVENFVVMCRAIGTIQ